MPKSRKRKRRDGSVVTPRQKKSKPLTRLYVGRSGTG